MIMAKFTIYFKEQKLNSKIFKTDDILIGRDENNHIMIDNLAVASKHAVITIKDEVFTIKQLNDKYPLIINTNKVTQSILNSGDIINLGKHTIQFDDEKFPIKESLLSLAKEESRQLNAHLQILGGPHIGRILPLKNAMTRFKHNKGKEIIIISRQKTGFTISSLEGYSDIQINQQELGNQRINLIDNDTLIINNISMKFMIDN